MTRKFFVFFFHQYLIETPPILRDTEKWKTQLKRWKKDCRRNLGVRRQQKKKEKKEKLKKQSFRKKWSKWGVQERRERARNRTGGWISVPVAAGGASHLLRAYVTLSLRPDAHGAARVPSSLHAAVYSQRACARALSSI